MTDSSYAVRFLFIAGITTAFKQAIDTLRRDGACVLNGLPPGEFSISIFRNNPLIPFLARRMSRRSFARI